MLPEKLVRTYPISYKSYFSCIFMWMSTFTHFISHQSICIIDSTVRNTLYIKNVWRAVRINWAIKNTSKVRQPNQFGKNWKPAQILTGYNTFTYDLGLLALINDSVDYEPGFRGWVLRIHHFASSSRGFELRENWPTHPLPPTGKISQLLNPNVRVLGDNGINKQGDQLCNYFGGFNGPVSSLTRSIASQIMEKVLRHFNFLSRQFDASKMSLFVIFIRRGNLLGNLRHARCTLNPLKVRLFI